MYKHESSNIRIVIFHSRSRFFLLILFKYTEQEHQKELEQYAWFREDKRKWLWDSDFALFTKIAEKSFIITKIIMLLLSLYMVAAGVLGLCMYFF